MGRDFVAKCVAAEFDPIAGAVRVTLQDNGEVSINAYYYVRCITQEEYRAAVDAMCAGPDDMTWAAALSVSRT